MPHLATVEIPLMSEDGCRLLGNSYDLEEFRPELETPDEPLDFPEYLDDEDENEQSQDFERKEMESAFSSWTVNTDRCSSLASWGDDDFDKQACKAVADMFADIDAILYDGASTSNANLEAECSDWRRKFPHLRIVGKQILPSVEKGYSTHPRPPSVILTHSGKYRDSNKQLGRLSVVGKKLDDSLSQDSDLDPSVSKFYEEIIEQHGNYEEMIAVDSVPNSPTIERRKTSDKKLSSEEKLRDQLISVVFDNLWKSVVPVLLPLVQAYSKRLQNVNAEITDYHQDVPRANLFEELSISRKSNSQKSLNNDNVQIPKAPKTPGPPERLLIDTYLTSAKTPKRLSPLPESQPVVHTVEIVKSNKYIREISEIDKADLIKPLPPLIGGGKFNKSGSRVVSAAHHRTVRFLQPIPAKPKTAIARRPDKNLKSSNRWSFRLPPISNTDSLSGQPSSRSNAPSDNGIALNREESVIRSKTLEDFMPLLRSSSIPPTTTTTAKPKERNLETVESLSSSDETDEGEDEVVSNVKPPVADKPPETDRKFLSRPQTKQNSSVRSNRGLVTKVSSSPRYASELKSKIALKKSNSLSPVRKRKPLPFRV